MDSPEVASSALVKVDSTDEKQHSTTPLIKDAFCLDYFAAITFACVQTSPISFVARGKGTSA